ncbi:MAG TPA: hypothetical protein VHK06_04260 [Candidatus Limnocylindria bacterium]|nr:hypothetical protein [Candidatus Limnocylindria bacterium]
MEQHLPATREEAPIERAGAEGAPVEAPEPEQDVSVILLPFAIVVFLVLSFTAAAWTLIASIGG